MNSKLALIKLSAALFAVAVIASGCKVVNSIEEDRAVSFNPCTLVGLEKVQAVMGSPMYERLGVSYSEDGKTEFGGCDYATPDTGPEFSVSVDDKTRTDTQGDPFLGEFDFERGTRKTNESIKSLKGLGREARYLFRKIDDAQDDTLVGSEESGDSLTLVVLSTKGAYARFNAREVNADEASLLSKVRSLAVPAVARMEKLFPGSEKPPPREDSPIPVCSPVSAEDMTKIYGSFWTLPPGESIFLEEAGEEFGGPTVTGDGPVGGGWVCGADLSPHEAEGYHPHLAWWISKTVPPAEPPAGAQRVRGLGASAFWRVVDETYWCCGKALTLSVFTKGGKHFDVEVDLERMEETRALSVARAVAEKIVVKLP